MGKEHSFRLDGSESPFGPYCLVIVYVNPVFESVKCTTQLYGVIEKP